MKKLLIAAAVLLMVAACGGGSSHKGASSQATVPLNVIKSRADACRVVNNIYGNFTRPGSYIDERGEHGVRGQLSTMRAELAAGSRYVGADDELLAQYRSLRFDDTATFITFLTWCASQGISVPLLPTTATTTPPTITTLAQACAKIHGELNPGGGGRSALVAVLPQLRAVFAGVPSDIGGNVVVPGLDDGSQLQSMYIWCIGHNDGQ